MPRIKLKNVDTGKWEELPLIQGKTGTSIKSVEQTTTSTESSGSNVITVTMSDNTSSTFTVRNGAKGDKGDRGEMGSLEDGSVTTEKLADGAITNAKLAQKSVTPLKLADYSVTNVKVADSAIDDRKLALDSVTTEKVVDRAITMRKLAQGSVATPNLVDGAVTSEKIDWTTIKGGSSIPIATKNTTMMYSVPCTLARVGNLVLLQINGNCNGTPDKDGSSIETLPVGFRPALVVNSAGYINATGGDTAIIGTTVRTNGQIAWSAAKTPAKNAYWRFAVTYPTADDWPS